MKSSAIVAGSARTQIVAGMSRRAASAPKWVRGGLWEVRSSLPSKREARVFFAFHDGMLIALHAIIKKGRKAPAEDLGLAKQRLKEMQSWQGRTRT
jgi:phage-related protein